MEITASTTAKRIAAIAVAALALAGAIWLARGPAPTRDAPSGGARAAVEAPEPVREPPPRASAAVSAPARARTLGKTTPEAPPPTPSAAPAQDDSEYWRLADIEDFKRELYELDIDSLDEIDQLDAFVHLETDDPRELWDTDWAGVDDWKRYQDGFSLERAHDGTLLFVPGAETQRQYSFFESVNTYTYDEENQSFINQVDFYGKPIFNVVKFLREDVLVMMTVSGEKVDLNIYQQGAYRE